jgi:hypothetical protein
MALKEGDRVRITLIGGNYRVKWIGDRVVVLETEDGLGQFLTTVDHLIKFNTSAKEFKNTERT